jgi:GNAT superfamily N-acetyltransferase
VTAGSADLEIRAATDDDRPAVLALLQASLGWVPDEAYDRFFAWKHRRSPFGPSPAWVVVDTTTAEVVGLRTFMRWELERDGAPVRAVRAVDTATHPGYQGRGVFTALTRHALDELREDGVAFVFNTPNDRSRPGYLKLGWRLVGRLPVAALPRSPRSLVRVARARTAADKWSAATDAGLPAAEALRDREAVALWSKQAAIVGEGDGRPPEPGALRTRRTPDYLAWRYGFEPLRYRALPVTDGPDGGGGADVAGIVIFRLRRRGEALEAAVCEELLPDDAGLRRRALRDLVRSTGADHAVVVGPPRPRHGLLPVPGQGPTLVCRGVCDPAAATADRWTLNLGDVELF